MVRADATEASVRKLDSKLGEAWGELACETLLSELHKQPQATQTTPGTGSSRPREATSTDQSAAKRQKFVEDTDKKLEKMHEQIRTGSLKIKLSKSSKEESFGDFFQVTS